MNHKQVIEKLNDLEAKYPVKDWLIDDIHIWPLLKYNIFKEWRNADDKPAKGQQRSKTFTDKIKNKFKRYYQIWKSGQKVAALKKSNVKKSPVLFTGFNAHRVEMDGMFVNRYFQPITTYLKKHFGYDSIMIEYRDRDKTKKYIDEGQIIFLPEFLPYFNYKYRSAYQQMSVQLNGYEEFSAEVLSLLPFLKNKAISTTALKGLVKEIKIFSHAYDLIIDKYDPKLAIGLCYYNKPVYGLDYAASKRNIPTVDMQHGGQGKLHVSYGSYESVPANGYNLMPTIFWCWDEASYNAINSWIVKQNHHRVVMGGNPWLDYFFDTIKREEFTFPEKKIILYSMQLDVPEDYIIEAIKSTPPDFEWWLRFHPRTTAETRQAVSGKIAAAGLAKKVELEKATSYPLPIILENTSVHISKFSGSIIEATQLGVKTILIDPVGVENFNDYVLSNNAVVELSKSAKELLETIAIIAAQGKDSISQDNLKQHQKLITDLLAN